MSKYTSSHVRSQPGGDITNATAKNMMKRDPNVRRYVASVIELPEAERQIELDNLAGKARSGDLSAQVALDLLAERGLKI